VCEKWTKNCPYYGHDNFFSIGEKSEWIVGKIIALFRLQQMGSEETALFSHTEGLGRAVLFRRKQLACP
jgi:hypothetical protein